MIVPFASEARQGGASQERHSLHVYPVQLRLHSRASWASEAPSWRDTNRVGAEKMHGAWKNGCCCMNSLKTASALNRPRLPHTAHGKRPTLKLIFLRAAVCVAKRALGSLRQQIRGVQAAQRVPPRGCVPTVGRPDNQK